MFWNAIREGVVFCLLALGAVGLFLAIIEPVGR